MNCIKYILYSVMGLMVLSCSKGEYDGVFDKSPDERINESVAAYKKTLQESEHGWYCNYFSDPGNLGAYTMAFKFGTDGVVKMNWSVRDEEDEGYYSVRSIEKPLLVFDTYCNFSKLTDPDVAMDGEVEFSILAASKNNDTLFMEERISKTEVLFVKG